MSARIVLLRRETKMFVISGIDAESEREAQRVLEAALEKDPFVLDLGGGDEDFVVEEVESERDVEYEYDEIELVGGDDDDEAE